MYFYLFQSVVYLNFLKAIKAANIAASTVCKRACLWLSACTWMDVGVVVSACMFVCRCCFARFLALVHSETGRK